MPTNISWYKKVTNGDPYNFATWSFNDDPVYAEGGDTIGFDDGVEADDGNTTGWGLNHQWRQTADALCDLYTGQQDRYTKAEIDALFSGESSGKKQVDWGNIINKPVVFTPDTHTHDTSEISSGTFSDSRIAVSNITQYTSSIDHDSLLNYNVSQHRIINDSGNSATELWSANKINTMVNAKADYSVVLLKSGGVELTGSWDTGAQEIYAHIIRGRGNNQLKLYGNNDDKGLFITPDGNVYVYGQFLHLPLGAYINEFSVDDTLAGNSIYAVPTEYAVKQYVDNAIAGSVDSSLFLLRDGTQELTGNWDAGGTYSIAIDNIIGSTTIGEITICDYLKVGGSYIFFNDNIGIFYEGDGIVLVPYLEIDEIKERNEGDGVTIEGILLKDGAITFNGQLNTIEAFFINGDVIPTTDNTYQLGAVNKRFISAYIAAAYMSGSVNVNTINEYSAGTGVTIDGVLLKDGIVAVNTINEYTTDAGVTIEGIKLIDSSITSPLKIAGGANDSILHLNISAEDYYIGIDNSVTNDPFTMSTVSDLTSPFFVFDPVLLSVRIGTSTVASGASSVAIGDSSESYDGYGISVGGGIAYGNADIAFGYLATTSETTGTGQIAIGLQAEADGTGYAIAIGYQAYAFGIYSIAQGYGAYAYSSGRGAQSALAIGTSAYASGVKYLTAIGPNTSATANYTGAFGDTVSCTAAVSFGLGYNFTNSIANSVALGVNNISFYAYQNYVGIGNGADSVNYYIEWYGATTQGYMRWLDASDAFQFDDDILMQNGERIYFRDANTYIYDDGTDFNIITNGVLKFGTHAAVTTETLSGFITIKDAAGNSRKLAVVS